MKTPGEDEEIEEPIDEYRRRAELLLNRGLDHRKLRKAVKLYREKQALDDLETKFRLAAKAIDKAALEAQESVIVRSFRAKTLAATLIACGLPARVLPRNRVQVDLRPLLEIERNERNPYTVE